MPAALNELLADDLARNLERLTDRVMERAMPELPELTGDPERVALARLAARALLAEFGAALQNDVDHAQFHAPATAIAFAQRLAREGIRLAVMLRAYRLGQEVVFERAARLAERISDADERASAITGIVALSFRYADGAMSDVSSHYDAERERVTRGSDLRRQALVRDLLAGLAVDRSEVELKLGYRLDGDHQGVVAWGSVGDGEALARAARQVATALGEGRALVIDDPSGHATAWVQPSAVDEIRLDREAERLRTDKIQVAIGEPARGLTGFSATKRQADLARSVAELRPDHTITRYADVALATVLLRDRDVARSFAQEELGRLAHGTRDAAQLRATLAAFYGATQDQSRTARALGLHRNTIANRLRRAEELLGHGIGERVRETEAALVITDALPDERPRRRDT